MKRQHIVIFSILLIHVVSFSFQPLHGALSKGPYLMLNGNKNTQMTVLWQTDKTESCTLEWGLTKTYGNTAISNEINADHQHQYVIPDLINSTKCYYQVTVGQKTSTGSFHSAPADTEPNIKLFAYGDTRTYPANHARVAGKISDTYTADPTYQTISLFVGDYNSLDTESTWAGEFFSRSQPKLLKLFSEMPLMPCRGNHEQSGTIFKKYFPYPYVSSFYYSFDYGPVHVAVVDQNPEAFPMIESEQLTWLQNDLSSTEKIWKIIVVHAPGFSAGPHLNNIQVQNEIHPLCVLYDVSFVISGENHYYARALVDGVNHITTGGGGAPLYTPSPDAPFIVASKQAYEFCKIDIRGKLLFFTAVDYQGNIIDTLTISKNTEPHINLDYSLVNTSSAPPILQSYGF